MKNVKLEISFRSAFIFLGILAALYIAYIIRNLLLLLFFAFILNSGFRPLVDRMHEKGIPRSIGILIIYLLFFGLMILIVSLIVTQLIEQASTLADSLPEFIENTLNTIKEEVPGAEEYLDRNDINTIVEDVQAALTGSDDLSSVNTENFFTTIIDLINILSSEGISLFESLTSSVFSLFIVIITSIYMLSREDDIYEGIVKLLPIKTGKEVTKVLKKIEVGLGEWLLALLTIMLIIGFLAYLIVSIPSLFLSSDEYALAQFAIIIGLISGLMEVIPQLGAVIAFLLTLILAIISGGSLGIVVYIGIMFLLLQQIEGLFISPIVMKRVVDVDPIVSIFSVLAGLQLGGPLLAVLTIPLVVTLQIIIEEVSGNWKEDKEKKKVIKDIQKHRGDFKEEDEEVHHNPLESIKERWQHMFGR